jgi:hypothetical protein
MVEEAWLGTVEQVVELRTAVRIEAHDFAIKDFIPSRICSWYVKRDGAPVQIASGCLPIGSRSLALPIKGPERPALSNAHERLPGQPEFLGFHPIAALHSSNPNRFPGGAHQPTSGELSRTYFTAETYD